LVGAKSTIIRTGAIVVLQPDDPGGALAQFAKGTNGGVYALAWLVAYPAQLADWFAGNAACPITVIPLDAGSESYTHEAVLDGARHWFLAG